jgi:hypothetical protein
VDEAAALAMDLDPRCLEHISDEEQTHERFLATKAWFVRNNKIFPGRISLESLWIVGRDNGEDNIPLNSRISHIVDLKQAGVFTFDQKIVALERKIEKLKKDKDVLQAKLASMMASNPTGVISSQKKKRATDELHYENTSSKLIVALMVKVIGEESVWKTQFARIKNRDRSVGIISGAVKAVHLLGWKIDTDTVLERFRAALKEYDPKDQ